MLLGNTVFYSDAGKDRVPSNYNSIMQHAFTELQPNVRNHLGAGDDAVRKRARSPVLKKAVC